MERKIFIYPEEYKQKEFKEMVFRKYPFLKKERIVFCSVGAFLKKQFKRKSDKIYIEKTILREIGPKEIQDQNKIFEAKVIGCT